MPEPVQMWVVDTHADKSDFSGATVRADASEILQPGAETSESVLPYAPINGLVRSLEKRRLQAYLAMLLGAVTIILGVFYGVSALYFGTPTNMALLDSGLLSAYLILPIYLTIAL